MSVAVGLDTVVAHGHADLVFSVIVGIDDAVLALYHFAIDLERYTVDGDVGILIEHLTADFER